MTGASLQSRFYTFSFEFGGPCSRCGRYRQCQIAACDIGCNCPGERSDVGRFPAPCNSSPHDTEDIVDGNNPPFYLRKATRADHGRICSLAFAGWRENIGSHTFAQPARRLGSSRPKVAEEQRSPNTHARAIQAGNRKPHGPFEDDDSCQ